MWQRTQVPWIPKKPSAEALLVHKVKPGVSYLSSLSTLKPFLRASSMRKALRLLPIFFSKMKMTKSWNLTSWEGEDIEAPVCLGLFFLGLKSAIRRGSMGRGCCFWQWYWVVSAEVRESLPLLHESSDVTSPADSEASVRLPGPCPGDGFLLKSDGNFFYLCSTHLSNMEITTEMVN